MIVIFVLEYFFGFFSFIVGKLNLVLEDSSVVNTFPDFLEIITRPITNSWLFTSYPWVGIIAAILLLFFSLKYISNAVIEIFGGEEKTRKVIHKFFKNKWNAFFAGVILTAICFNSNVTIGLLVPLAAARLINLYKAIPYIIGAKIGTVTDTILSALIVGKSISVSLALVYASFGVIGALIWLPQTGNLFKITKYLSKKIMHVSKTRALIFLGIFILIPLLLILLL
jgi:solute carrier family 34 (sodium-dependent phosphate cotransporter)